MYLEFLLQSSGVRLPDRNAHSVIVNHCRFGLPVVALWHSLVQPYLISRSLRHQPPAPKQAPLDETVKTM